MRKILLVLLRALVLRLILRLVLRAVLRVVLREDFFEEFFRAFDFLVERRAVFLRVVRLEKRRVVLLRAVRLVGRRRREAEAVFLLARLGVRRFAFEVRRVRDVVRRRLLKLGMVFDSIRAAGRGVTRTRRRVAKDARVTHAGVRGCSFPRRGMRPRRPRVSAARGGRLSVRV